MSTTITENTKTEVSLDTSALEDQHKYAYDRLEPYEHLPETKEELPWAELVTLDLEDYDRPGGKERLAKQLEHAVHHVGFFYVKNFGLSQEQVDQQFTLAKNFFNLDDEVKKKSEVNYAGADHNGWRRFRTNIESFNIPKFTKDFEGQYVFPDLINAHLSEIEVFSRALHSNVVLPLLRLFGIILQLPDEEYLAKQHSYDKKSEDHFRYMIYRKRTPEEHAAADFGQTGGHTDLGTLTLLFRQPIAGLQILGDDGNWTYVSAQPGTITVNLADSISHLTGGWLKSSVHRVVSPPKDQYQYDRTGLLYFSRPHNDFVLNPIEDSPVLKQAGVKSRFVKPVTVEEWVRAKQALQLNPEITAKKYEEGGDDTIEVIAGFKDRRYK